ncbi:recombinase family protein, partial [Bradyrhizobium sp. NBAIM08]|uniref:recombinase family protein n=1 Tax=Bradyrhizobium sp. NBAIM08 TaxID=2793815 RepID=UPI001CD77952
VYASDRLTRNLAHLILLREEWRRLEAELHFVNRGKSEDNPEHRMTENIEGVFNDYWREKILESTMRGKRRKAQAGLWVGGGPTPYGYARRGKGKKAQLAILEREAAIVRQIFAWYIGAGAPALMTAEIAERLTAAGVP